MTSLDLALDVSPETSQSLRAVVRAAVGEIDHVAQCDAWLFGHDPDFTRILAAHHLIGVTWPRAFGGREASAVDRLVVTEELLRVGAPVAAHWIADRQIGLAILRYGTQELQQALLPGIAAGEITFCLGMSESESGSDLAAVQTRALPVDGGFRVTGRKIWTSNAHRSTHAYVLARVPGGEGKRDGLTELVVHLGSPGLDVRPILDLNGEHHFNETILEEVFVPAANVLGAVGNGWNQVTEQLSFERGGIERVLSTYPVLAELLERDLLTAEHHVAAGDLVGRLHALRGLAVSVASDVDNGKAPVRRAAMLKYLGTSFECALVEFARDVIGSVVRPGLTELHRLVGQGMLRSPGATLRGGTTEVLLGILARGTDDPVTDDLAQLVGEALADLDRPESAPGLGEVWGRAVQLGWSAVGLAEDLGGSGGDLADLATIVRGHGRRGLPVPVVEGTLAALAVARAGRTDHDLDCPRSLALGEGLQLADGVVSGRLVAVPWLPFAREVVARAVSVDGPVLVRISIDAPGVTVEEMHDIAGDPVSDLAVQHVLVSDVDVLGGADLLEELANAQLVLRSAALLGAMEYAVALAAEHASTRTQFGRPLRDFQAVGQQLARASAEVALAESAVTLAVEESLRGPGRRGAAAQIVVARGAGTVARIAHQVLGAMGMTREHPLHRATLHLWSWQDLPVPARELARSLGSQVATAGEDAMWEWLVHETDDLGTDTAQ